MSERKAVPTLPWPLESYAARFDDLWAKAAQRESFRAYLHGLLLPRDRNKTLTALAGARPIEEAQHARVQKLQYFLSESPWDGAAINTRRLELLLADPSTAPHQEGVLIIDDSGDRKSGTRTDHVARQYLGSVGKIDNGIVAVSPDCIGMGGCAPLLPPPCPTLHPGQAAAWWPARCQFPDQAEAGSGTGGRRQAG